MMMTLQQLVHQAEILRKSLNRQLKTLRQQARRGSAPQPADLDQLQPQLREVLDLEITRAEADAEHRVDVVVDGQTILTQVTVPTLLAIRKQLKRQQRLYRTLQSDPPAMETLLRLDLARMAVEQAIMQANARQVEKQTLAQPLMDYLFR